MHKMMKKMKGGKMRKMMGALGGGMGGGMPGGMPGGGAGMPDLAGMDQKELAKLAKQFK
jgi:signal recognition particle subunit SRP54